MITQAMTRVAAPQMRYHHVVGFNTSEAMYRFTVGLDTYGLELADIDFDYQYHEARCFSDRSLEPAQMSAIALSGEVCYLVLNSVEPCNDNW